MDNKYDLLIIGAGPGGYTAAVRAARLGRKTAVVEEREAGGTCLNRGCIPTKALLHSAQLYREIRAAGRFGITVGEAGFDPDKIYAYQQETVETLRAGVENLLKTNGVDLIRGHACIRAAQSPNEKHSVIVSGEDGGSERILTANSILIAAGAGPADIPVPGADLPGIGSSDSFLSAPPPANGRLLIVGGGVIGAEFATIFSSLGLSVTIVEILPSLLNGMDREISQNLKLLFKKRGIEVFTDSKVLEFIKGGGGEILCRIEGKDREMTVEADQVLIASGRKPHTIGLFEEGHPVRLIKGAIPIDDRFETEIPGIYAIGDVTGGIQLAHYAAAQGTAAAEVICGVTASVDLAAVPSCVYTDPEIACVGITEVEAKKAGIRCRIGKALMGANGKSVITKEERGFIRLIFEEESRILIGAHLMCARATDMIGELTAAIGKRTAGEIASAMRAHPTYYEAVTEAAEKAV